MNIGRLGDRNDMLVSKRGQIIYAPARITGHNF